MATVMSNEPLVRFIVFGGVLGAMAAWELAAPRRKQELGRKTRWPGNLGIVVLDTLLVRLIFPMGAVAVAFAAEERAWGLFNTISVPAWVAVLGSIMLLDLAIYLQHVLFHAVPA